MNYLSNLDILQKLFSIVGSLSLGVALAAYFYKKKQDETLATIEQIAFFREKIIPEWDKVNKAIKKKDQNYWFSRITLDKYNIEDIRKERSRNFDNQLSIFFDSSKIDVGAWLDNSILDQQIFLLNTFEEFSLKVNHFNTQQHPALNSVHSAFVEIIEKNAVSLFFVRDVIVDNPIYDATLSVYKNWEKKVNKSNFAKNLKKHGFITKAQLEEIFNKQRGRVKK